MERLVKMTTIYKVFNPTIGTYETETYNSEEEANVKAKEVAWAFYLSHTHETPISKVEVTNDGSEIYS